MAGTITVSLQRFRELEELERSLPSLIEKALVERKANRLKLLREKDKADATLVRERARRYAEKHRESINERRRLKRHPDDLPALMDSAPASAPTFAEVPTFFADITQNLVVVETSHENLKADGPGTDHGEPKEGDVIPDPVRPILLEGAGQEHSETPQPKRKGRPKKVHK
jgi:hypothetical protein